MSKIFLTKSEVAVKLRLGSTLPSGKDIFATKLDCIGMGADPAPLSGYQDRQFPVDDDIRLGVKTSSFLLQFFSNGGVLNEKGGDIVITYV